MGATAKWRSDGAKPPKDIRKRSFQYALRAIRLYQFLQKGKDGAGWILGKQYLRAATSIGANIEEAQSGETKADFIHKYGIAQKEAKESYYWLRLMAESEVVPAKRLSPLMRETEEVYAVITAIIVNAKQGRQGPYKR
ncbi:MAG: four helix bundle protein [Acidobacteria bacterium]|nr:MAG: four helix bundle protein [Acidobacteriota bacterium]